MAPSAVIDFVERSGQQLEETSDNIDAVNVLKAKMKNTPEKAKTEFRQYEDACGRVKNFYREQHIKQTVAYNLKV